MTLVFSLTKFGVGVVSPLRGSLRERDRWLAHMAAAIEAVSGDIVAEHRDEVVEMLASYMVNAAEHLRNTD